MLKVGMRVRVIADHIGCGFGKTIIGREAWIIADSVFSAATWEIAVDGERFHWYASSSELAPLTDPKAEEFIAKLKKLGNEPVELTPKQMEEVRG